MLVLGVLLFLISFLSWYRVRYNIPVKGIPPRIVSFNAWRSGFFAWASVLAGMATAAFAGARIGGRQFKMRITSAAVYLLSGVVIFFMTGMRFLIKPAGLSGLPISAQFVEVGRAFGLYLAFVIAVGMLVTGFRAYQSERGR
jgi:hypothetical protein